MVSIIGRSRGEPAGAPDERPRVGVLSGGLERASGAAPRSGSRLCNRERIADAPTAAPGVHSREARALDRARARGADVRGYFHWSLLDNFEWDDGFHGRFGLCAVDFEKADRPRTPRQSGRVYARK